MSFARFGLFVLALTFGYFAWAAAQQAQQPPTKDAQSQYEPKSVPGDGQKFLARMAGDWEVEKKFYPRAGGEPSVAKGECKQAMVNDGRFLKSDFVFQEGGTKSTGLGLIGFDPAPGTFTSVWADSRQTRMSLRQSEGKFSGDEIVLFSKTVGDEKDARRSRTVSKLEDGDRKLVHRQYNVAADGPERLIMELLMTRKPAAASVEKKSD